MRRSLFLIVAISVFWSIFFVSVISTHAISNGTIHVRATKDGQPWDSPAFTFSGTGPGGAFTNYSIDPPQNPGSLPGTYIINSVTPPAGVTLKSVNGSSLPYSITLPAGGEITVTYNFVSVPVNGTIHVRAIKDGVAWDSPSFATNITHTPGTTYDQPLDLPQDFSNIAIGDYRVNSVIPPAGIKLQNIDGRPLPYTVTLPAGGEITVTYNFVSVPVNDILPIGYTATYKGGGQLWAASRINSQTIVFQRWTDPLSSNNVVWRSRSQDGRVMSESSSELYYSGMNLYTEGVPADTFGSVDGSYDIWITKSGIYVASSVNSAHPSEFTALRIGYGNNPVVFSKQWCGYQTICNKFFARDLWDGWPLWGFLLQKENSNEVTEIILVPFGPPTEIPGYKNFENIQGYFVNQGAYRQYRGYNPSPCSDWTKTLGLCTNGSLYAGIGASVRFLVQKTIPWWAETSGNNTLECVDFGMPGASYPKTAVAPHGVAMPIISRTSPTRAESTWSSSTEGLCAGSPLPYPLYPLPDITPPVISAITTVPTSSGTIISWTTNEASDSQVEYGLTASYGLQSTLGISPAADQGSTIMYSALPFMFNTSLAASHSITLSGLSSATLYHYRVKSKDALGNLAISSDETLTIPPDITPPSVSLTAPANGASVSGNIVAVSTSASDNVGVAGMQFKLDGANLGTEDTSSPYSIVWDTTNTTDAPHILTAVARDAAGNTTTATNVGVTVANNNFTSPSHFKVTIFPSHSSGGSSGGKKDTNVSGKITYKSGERTAPYITLITPKVGTSTTPSLLIRVSAMDQSGIQAIKVTINGTLKKRVNTNFLSYTAKDVKGTATINVTAYDTLGNAKTASIIVSRGKVVSLRYY